jgi:hypothetical protein
MKLASDSDLAKGRSSMPNLANDVVFSAFLAFAGFVSGLILGGPLRRLCAAMLGKGEHEIEQVVAEFDARLKALETKKTK